MLESKACSMHLALTSHQTAQAAFLEAAALVAAVEQLATAAETTAASVDDE